MPPSLITSTSNPRIKLFRKLADRKYRQETGLYAIEGLRILGEASEHGGDFETLVVAPDLLRSEFGLEQARRLAASGVETLYVSAEVFQSLAHKDNPQGVFAVLRQNWRRLDDLKPDEQGSWVALDQIADPGNLGTILRTHDAVGGRGVILMDQCVDPYDPSTTRASMGALYTQIITRASLAEFADWKRAHGLRVVGASGAAAADYTEVRYPAPLVLMMGSERQGLQDRHYALCDEVARIPMVGSADSLNLAVATAILLYEAFNQQRRTT